MLSKVEIKTLRTIAETLELTRAYAKARTSVNNISKPISTLLIDKLNLADREAAKKLAKSIRATFVDDKNLGEKISSLTVSDIKANNTFIVIEDNLFESYLSLVWTGS